MSYFVFQSFNLFISLQIDSNKHAGRSRLAGEQKTGAVRVMLDVRRDIIVPLSRKTESVSKIN